MRWRGRPTALRLVRLVRSFGSVSHCHGRPGVEPNARLPHDVLVVQPRTVSERQMSVWSASGQACRSVRCRSRLRRSCSTTMERAETRTPAFPASCDVANILTSTHSRPPARSPRHLRRSAERLARLASSSGAGRVARPLLSARLRGPLRPPRSVARRPTRSPPPALACPAQFARGVP